MIRVVPARKEQRGATLSGPGSTNFSSERSYCANKGAAESAETHPFAPQCSGAPGSRGCGFLKIRSLLLLSQVSLVKGKRA
jgi:hypothetical protein